MTVDNLNWKVIAYLNRHLEPKEATYALDNNGNQYILNWNVLNVPKPTEEQLNALSVQAEQHKINNDAISNRKIAYGTVEKQIEFITENGLQAWQEKVSAIKLQYPKVNITPIS